MRIYGIPDAVTDINCRLLIEQLLADESPEALNLAERLSNALTRKEAAAPLVPGERDILLRNIPNPPPSGLAPLRQSSRQRQARPRLAHVSATPEKRLGPEGLRSLNRA